MREVHLRLQVHENGSIDAVSDEALPPGEHDAVVMVDGPPPQAKPFSMAGFPRHEGDWDHTQSLRREDIYGDDGR